MHMATILSIAIVACFVFGFLIWRGSHEPEFVELKIEDVISALRNVLDLDGAESHDEFDLFITNPIKDPNLEEVRRECLAVIDQNRGARPQIGRDLDETSEIWVREKLNELQSIKASGT